MTVPMFAGLPLHTEDEAEDYGKWLIHGPQGAGKSTLASTLAEMGPCLFIDLTGERGVRSFKGAPYGPNIRIVRPASITALDDVFWQLATPGHPFKSVVLDSLTSAQKMTMRFLLGHDETAVREIRTGTAPADQRTWGQSLDVMTDIATFWFSLADATRQQPMHVAMTAQTKATDNEMTGQATFAPDVQRGALSITLAAPDYIVFCDIEDNMDAIADPSLPASNHIVRFGANPKYRTKARVPVHLRGKVPTIMGRAQPLSLTTLSRVLGVGGVPPLAAAPAAAPQQ